MNSHAHKKHKEYLSQKNLGVLSQKSGNAAQGPGFLAQKSGLSASPLQTPSQKANTDF